MAEHTRRYRSYVSYDPDVDPYDEDPTNQRIAPYRFGHSAKDYSGRDNSVPLFLSDSDGEPHPSEYPHMAPLRKHRAASLSSWILASVLVIAATAVVFAGFSSDAMRDVIASAKISIAAAIPASPAAAKPDTRLKPVEPLKDPTRLPGPANQALVNQAPVNQAPVNPAPVNPGLANQVTGVRSAAAAEAPTRTQIATAYQGALQGGVRAGPAPVAAPPTRKLGADELAVLLNRAKGLLATGDIPSARLLLERAADAQESGAALMLARTYDPDVLGTQDARNIIPDPATARAWYQKAAEFGSAEAQRRLTQMQY